MVYAANAKVEFNECEIVAVSAVSSSVFFLADSTLQIRNSGITVGADRYAAGVTAEGSIISAENMRIAAAAQTAVLFTVSGGELTLRNSIGTVTATLGRIAELSGVKYRMTDNTFTSNPYQSLVTGIKTVSRAVSGISAIWADHASTLLEKTRNTETGFSQTAGMD
jgi:hypothetical protein